MSNSQSSNVIGVGTKVLQNSTVGRLLFAGANNVMQQDGSLFWDNTNKRFGVGGTPQARVHISGAISGAENALLVNTSHTASFSTAVNVNPVRTGVNTGYFSALAFEPQLNTDGSVTVSDLWGITGNPRMLGASNVSRAVAFRANIQHTSSGVISSAYGFLLESITKTTGSITNAYGLYINDLAAVAANNWAIYTVGTAPTRLGGMLDLSGIAAGSPNIGITKTTDTPSTTFSVVNATNAAPSGFMEILEGGTSKYIPFYA